MNLAGFERAVKALTTRCTTILVGLVAVLGILAVLFALVPGVNLIIVIASVVIVIVVAIVVMAMCSSGVKKRFTQAQATLNQVVSGGEMLGNNNADDILDISELRGVTQGILDELYRLRDERAKGNLVYHTDTKRFNGVYAAILGAAIDAVDASGATLSAVNAAAKGLVDGKISDDLIKTVANPSEALLTLETLRKQLVSVVASVEQVKAEVASGHFSSDSYEKAFPGVFRPILANLQTISDNVRSKNFWYEGMLNAIPFPISVTDIDMNWTFINTPVEKMLGVKRADMVGRHCSNWGAGICKTENCGVTCLKRGKTQTFFSQGGGYFQVNSDFLYNEQGDKVGHIEVVQDITALQDFESKHTFIEQINESMRQFSSVASTLSSSSQQTAEGANTQSQLINTLAHSIMDLLERASQTGGLAHQASQSTREIRVKAEQGNAQMKNMLQSVSDMSEANRSIYNIIKNIQDIAFQTNILALNASIEAARAGAAGKGFVVVAEEVRNLATMSSVAAEDSSRLIGNSLEKAAVSERIVSDTIESFGNIVEGIMASDANTQSIATSAESQVEIIEKINQDIARILQIVQQNSASAEESAAASEELSSQVMSLQQEADRFLDEAKKK